MYARGMYNFIRVGSRADIAQAKQWYSNAGIYIAGVVLSTDNDLSAQAQSTAFVGSPSIGAMLAENPSLTGDLFGDLITGLRLVECTSCEREMLTVMQDHDFQ